MSEQEQADPNRGRTFYPGMDGNYMAEPLEAPIPQSPGLAGVEANVTLVGPGGPALLPCPFCGAADEIHGHTGDGLTDEDGTHYICCGRCGTSGPGYNPEDDYDNPTPEQGIAGALVLWQDRTDTELAELCGLVRAYFEAIDTPGGDWDAIIDTAVIEKALRAKAGL